MDLFNRDDLTVQLLTESFPILAQPLSLINYVLKCHLLLYLEEHSELVVVRSFDLVSVTIFFVPVFIDY